MSAKLKTSSKMQTPREADQSKEKSRKVFDTLPDVLSSEFVDDQTLLKHYGLTRRDHKHFNKVYWSLPRWDRPTLSIYFDPVWYLTKYPDVAAHDNVDPFVHFYSFGLAEGRQPHPLVDLNYIGSQIDNGLKSLKDLLEIIDQGRVSTSPYFDVTAYREHFRSVGLNEGLLRHFLSVPSEQVFIPCDLFDAKFYIERYYDVPRNPREAFLHFAGFGDFQSRVPSAAFDPEWYLRNYQDVASVGALPLRHFLIRGLAEGRSPVGKQIYQNGGGVRQARSQIEVEIDGVKSRALYASITEAIDDRRVSKIRAVNEVDFLPHKSTNIEDSIRSLHFKKVAKPTVSILIPVYNELRVTVECLLSIMHAATKTSFEVYVADDCSPEKDLSLLKDIPGLRYHRNASNLNFLLNSNRAYEELRGKYILLLNNDAQVCIGAIDKLVSALQDPTVGAVGPKILFPNGRLQEAGCSINLDASANMIGLFQNRNDAAYSYSRDVDYISGAALMVKRSVIGETLFTEALAPAYCEDLDLCLRIKAKGYRVRYVADAEVVHHLSISMSDESKKKLNVIRNQEKIFAEWHQELAKLNKVRVISYYLPQFHPIPENDYWWGAGFTEWTNVVKAEPSYAGHYQPHLPSDLGFYDLRVKEVYLKQAALLKRYGLGGLCLYYYNFGGERFLGRPLQIILDNKDIDLPFCLCWANENWSKRWDGGSKDLLLGQSYDEKTIRALIADVIVAAQDERYIRVDGKPIFLIYRPLLIPDLEKTISLVREVSVLEGKIDLHLVFVESLESLEADVSPLSFGFDASVEFPPHGIGVPATEEREILKPNWRGNRFDYEKTVVNAVHRRTVPWPRYPGAFPSWDNTARQPLAGTSFDNCSPEVFQRYVQEQIRKAKNTMCGDQRMVFINAWNEWAEGAHLEPDRAYGHRWLEAIRTALEIEGSI